MTSKAKRVLTKRQCDQVADVLRRRVSNATTRSHDARLPPNAAQTLRDALPGIVERARVDAAGREDVRALRDGIRIARHGQRAAAQLRQVKTAAGRALRVIRAVRPPEALEPWRALAAAALSRLVAESDAELVSPKKKTGVPANLFRRSLAVSLAHWWLDQGWRPVRSSSGAFSLVLRSILDHLGEPAPAEFDHQMMINAIGEAAERDIVQAEIQRQLTAPRAFDADAFLRRAAANKRPKASAS